MTTLRIPLLPNHHRHNHHLVPPAGVPPTLLDEYPVLKAYRNKIASVPAIKEYYDKHGEGYRAAFKSDAK